MNQKLNFNNHLINEQSTLVSKLHQKEKLTEELRKEIEVHVCTANE